MIEGRNKNILILITWRIGMRRDLLIRTVVIIVRATKFCVHPCWTGTITGEMICSWSLVFLVHGNPVFAHVPHLSVHDPPGHNVDTLPLPHQETQQGEDHCTKVHGRFCPIESNQRICKKRVAMSKRVSVKDRVTTSKRDTTVFIPVLY